MSPLYSHLPWSHCFHRKIYLLLRPQFQLHWAIRTRSRCTNIATSILRSTPGNLTYMIELKPSALQHHSLSTGDYKLCAIRRCLSIPEWCVKITHVGHGYVNNAQPFCPPYCLYLRQAQLDQSWTSTKVKTKNSSITLCINVVNNSLFYRVITTITKPPK